MAKNRKSIVIIIALLLVIVAAFVVLRLTEDLGGDDTTLQVPTQPRERIFVLGAGHAYSPAALTIEVHNEYGSYTIINTNPDEAPSRFTLVGFEDYYLRTNRLLLIGNSARSMSADLLFEDGADLAALGLDNPRATATIDYVDGTSAVLLIGDNVPGGGSTYVMRQGYPAVYLISEAQASYFLHRTMDFIDVLLTEQIRDGFPELTKVILGGTVRPEPIVIEIIPPCDDAIFTFATHMITYPVYNRLHGTFGLEPLRAVYSQVAERVEAHFTSPEELKQWGLYEPFSTIDVYSATHESFKLLISEPDRDGLIYVVRDGWPFVFVSNSSFMPWLELTYFEMMDRLLILPFIDFVSVVEIHLPDQVIKIELSGEGNDLEVVVNGEPYETNEGIDPIRNFRTFYQVLLSASYDSVPDVEKPPNAPILVQIIYNYRDGSPPDVVTIFEGAARRVFMQLNDETPMFGLSAYVDHLLRNIENFLNGDDVILLF